MKIIELDAHLPELLNKVFGGCPSSELFEEIAAYVRSQKISIESAATKLDPELEILDLVGDILHSRLGNERDGNYIQTLTMLQDLEEYRDQNI